MSSSSGFPWKTLLIILVILITLCCCLALVGGGVFYYMAASGMELPEGVDVNFNLPGDGEENSLDSIQPTMVLPAPVEPVPVQPTATSQPEVVEEPTPSGPVLTGNQEWSDYRFFDDFTSNALDWYQYDDGNISFLIEDETYTIHIVEPDGFDWAFFPGDFYHHEISLDIKSLDRENDGFFEIFCNYLDKDNYYYIDFDLGTKEYEIGKFVNDVLTPLTKETDDNYFWNTTTELKSSTSVNHIGVSCYPSSITLFINNNLVEQITVPNPLEESGRGGLSLYTFENADENGYKIAIDNVEVFEPQQ